MTITAEESKAALASGEHLGHQLLPAVKWHEGQLGSDHEKLLWWAAFLGSLRGMCAASIGPGALEAIGQMTAKTTGKVLASKAN